MSDGTDPRRIGRYTVERRLGAGGMGAVYLGRSPGGLRVAIKVIRAEFAADPQFRARFRREISAVRAISALYTAPIVDADPDAEAPWFAATYLDGESLEERVQRDGPRPAQDVYALAAATAETLAAIHAAGLVHRDLKPSNVILTADGPRVIDFGIARTPDGSALTVGYLGTIAYSSPEHFDTVRMGPPSDIYCLGATLHFAATGRSPAGTGTTPELIGRIVQGRLDLSALPTDLAGLVEPCLRLDPADRPTPAELLRRALAGLTPPIPSDGAARPTVEVPAAPPTATLSTAAPPTAIPPTVAIRPARRRWTWWLVAVTAIAIVATLTVMSPGADGGPPHSPTRTGAAPSGTVPTHPTGTPTHPAPAPTTHPIGTPTPTRRGDPGATGHLRLHAGTLSCHYYRLGTTYGKIEQQDTLEVQARYDWIGTAFPSSAFVTEDLAGPYTPTDYHAGGSSFRPGRTGFAFLGLATAARAHTDTWTITVGAFVGQAPVPVPETDHSDDTVYVRIHLPAAPLQVSGTVDNQSVPLHGGTVPCEIVAGP